MAILKASLETFSINPERVWFKFISASEGKLFAQTVTEMVARLKQMGPIPTKEIWEI
jgi:F420-non-reducing hydrogenase iron-sulfur subunit